MANQVNKKEKIFSIINNNKLLVVLIVLIIAGYFISDRFLTYNNIMSMLSQLSLVGIVACGVTFNFISRNVDVSVGAVVSLTCVIAILLQPYGWIFATIIALLAGIATGSLNGFIIGKLKGNSLIITLAMMVIVSSFEMQLTGEGRILYGDRLSPFSFFGKQKILGIPFPIILWIIIILISYFLLTKIRIGKYIFSIGTDENVAWLYGIRVSNVKILIFIISGFLAAISGVILASKLSGAMAYIGDYILYEAFIAVILGGTSLSGGRGSIGNTLVGVLIVGVILNLALLLGLDYYLQDVIRGIILIIVLLFDKNRVKEDWSFK